MKTKKVFIILICFLSAIVIFGFGLYINKQVISFLLGAIATIIFEIGIYFKNGWDKETLIAEDLQLRINQVLYKLENEEKTKKQDIIDILKGV